MKTKNTLKILNFLAIFFESVGVGTVLTLMIFSLFQNISITLIPGIATFGVPYFIIRCVLAYNQK